MTRVGPLFSCKGAHLESEFLRFESNDIGKMISISDEYVVVQNYGKYYLVQVI